MGNILKVMFRKYVFVMCFAVSLFSVNTSPVSAGMQEIVAVVNTDAISVSDLNKRMRLVMVSSGLPNTQEIRQKLMPQVLGGLINEQLMLQEARKLEIEIKKDEVDSGFAKVAAQNKIEPKKFIAMIQKSGVDISTMEQQIRAQVAWGKVVTQRLRPRIIISERDIDDALQRIQSKIGTTEYLTAEIFLPVVDPRKNGEILRLSKKLVYEVKTGKASFFKLAQQFSQAAGSSQGGNKGWVNEAQLDPELLDGLKSIEKNQVTDPIKTINGYHILFLRNQRILSEDTVPSREQIEYSIGSDRLEKMQRRHLQDLRTASFVDIRV